MSALAARARDDIAKRQRCVRRPMTAGGFSAALATSGLDKEGAVRVLGFSPRMARRYANDEWPAPPVIAGLLRLMIMLKAHEQVAPETLNETDVTDAIRAVAVESPRSSMRDSAPSIMERPQ
jgi:hypothetical protein